MIQPTTRFGQMGPQRIQGSHATKQRDIRDIPSLIREAGDVSPNVLNVTFCNTTIVPACLRALYRMNETGADPDAPGSFGVAGFLEVIFSSFLSPLCAGCDK
jgi:tripeptidyl-peptidase I